MQLKNLEIHGFKTFANPTTLEFSSGITAIVGPNGSGKSNVSDALMWVLGEQNIRTLRGGKLQDVIFAGSSSRRPIGMAEVALTFDNSSRVLPLDFNEITVTRRVYRSDESEYFINRTSCRLRDIVDLFLDTGIGRESYFALNQGEIDMILSADPEERRSLFEEAAGVKKYRVRKKESLRKLESTEQNLVRIHDLISEVESRVGPLERQAEAARRYRELAELLRTAELGVFAADWTRLARLLEENENRLQAARAETGAVDAALAALGAEEEQLRLALQEADAALETAHRRQEDLVGEQARAEGRLKTIEERIRSGEAAVDRARLHLASLAGQQEELRSSHAEQKADLSAVDLKLRTGEQAMTARRQRLNDLENRWRAAVAALESAQSRAVDRAAKQARFLADREAAEARWSAVQARLQELEGRAAELRSRVDALRARQADLQSLEAAASTHLETVRSEIDAAKEQVLAKQAQLAAHDELMRGRERQVSGDSSRLKVLEELQDQREGFFKGVRAVLQAAGSANLPGHYRAIADILSMESAYELALEAALGGSAQDIVTQTDQEAREGIYFLKRTGAGRATFLSLEIVSRLARPGGKPSSSGPGVVGAALDLVQFEPVYRPVVEMLLGRVVVCEDLEQGNAAARRLSQWSRIVTLDGEVISSQGAMTGGSRQQTRSSILGRTGQIRQLRSSVRSSQEMLDEQRTTRDGLRAQAEEARQRQQTAERKFQQLTTEAAQRNRDRAHLAQEDQRLQREQQALSREIARAHDQESIEQKAVERFSQPAAVGPTGDPARESLDSLRGAVSQAAGDREALREEMAQIQAEEAGLRERRRSLAAGLDEIGRRLDRLSSEEKTIKSQSDEAAGESARLMSERLALQETTGTLTEAITAARAGAAEAREGRSAIMERLQQLSAETRDLHQRAQVHSQAVFVLESERSALEGERERIRSVLADDYAAAAPLDESASEGMISERPASEAPVELPAGEPGSGPPLSDAEVASFLEGVSPSERPDKDRQTAARLRRQMRALEPVNLGAIEESAEVLERLEFLKTQRADIEAAARDLGAVIHKIDQETRERFMATFSAVALHFEDLFRQLFGGGQTRLSLTDPANPSDSGIEISAQPPGKKLQNLQLLSGGERSLTAVALLFAMLRVRPVPFCIMDEVDAALDEANVARFGEMLKEFARKTQFVVITHNRGTMEVANRLYGVTMTEPGISRVLSVTLQDVEPSGGGNGRRPAAAVPEPSLV